MQHFTFAQYSPDDRHNFTLVCFEASLEHIRNGSLNYLIAPANQRNLEAVSLYDTTFSPIQVWHYNLNLNNILTGQDFHNLTIYDTSFRNQ